MALVILKQLLEDIARWNSTVEEQTSCEDSGPFTIIPPPDVSFFELVMRRCMPDPNSARMQEAFSLMLDAGVIPNDALVSTMVQNLRKYNEKDNLLQIVPMARSLQVPLSLYTYQVLLEGMFRAGLHPTHILQLKKELEADGFRLPRAIEEQYIRPLELNVAEATQPVSTADVVSAAIAGKKNTSLAASAAKPNKAAATLGVKSQKRASLDSNLRFGDSSTVLVETPAESPIERTLFSAQPTPVNTSSAPTVSPAVLDLDAQIAKAATLNIAIELIKNALRVCRFQSALYYG